MHNYIKRAPLIVFDKRSGVFIKGKKAFKGKQGASEIKGRLKDIYSLQIIPEHYVYDEGQILTYEINLVQNDGNRIHLIDQGNFNIVEQQVNTLSKFLGVPIWIKPYKGSRWY